MVRSSGATTLIVREEINSGRRISCGRSCLLEPSARAWRLLRSLRTISMATVVMRRRRCRVRAGVVLRRRLYAAHDTADADRVVAPGAERCAKERWRSLTRPIQNTGLKNLPSGVRNIAATGCPSRCSISWSRPISCISASAGWMKDCSPRRKRTWSKLTPRASFRALKRAFGKTS